MASNFNYFEFDFEFIILFSQTLNDVKVLSGPPPTPSQAPGNVRDRLIVTYLKYPNKNNLKWIKQTILIR
jgi:hypothetical protein